MDILQLSHYLDNLLDIPSINDSPNALNGLQVQNTGEIKKIGLAVDLCQATIDLAIEKRSEERRVGKEWKSRWSQEP